MTLPMPGKFTLGAAVALLALIALFLTMVVTSTGPVEGSGDDCEYDVVAMVMSCTPSEETPAPTEAFDPARWMPVPAVLHDGTLSRSRNTGPSALMPPMPPIDGFTYSFSSGSSRTGVRSPSGGGYPVGPPPTAVNGPSHEYQVEHYHDDSGEIPTSTLLDSNGTRSHRIIVGWPDAKTPPPPQPVRVWFADRGYGPGHQPSEQQRTRIATGPFYFPVVGFDAAADSPTWVSGNTTIAPAWNRLKAITFEEEAVWRNSRPIGFDPGTYNTAEVLRIHREEAERRARLMAQDRAASFPNARNVRITVEVEVTEVPNTVGGAYKYYNFAATATMTGTEDGLVYNSSHSSAAARQEIERLEASGRVNPETLKVRVGGRDYSVGSGSELVTVVGYSGTTPDGTGYVITNVIHQINQDGTIVFGNRATVDRVTSPSGCQSGCLGRGQP